MDDNQRLKLQNMIAANNVENNTELIRELKHSHILRQDVSSLLMLKVECGNNLCGEKGGPTHLAPRRN
jgi:hypothetical protein